MAWITWLTCTFKGTFWTWFTRQEHGLGLKLASILPVVWLQKALFYTLYTWIKFSNNKKGEKSSFSGSQSPHLQNTDKCPAPSLENTEILVHRKQLSNVTFCLAFCIPGWLQTCYVPLNFWSSCLYLPGTRITGIYTLCQVCAVLQLNPGPC